MRVSTTDLSLSGCYVENMYTLPIGARLKIRLWIDEAKQSIKGIVKTCDPVFGNGIQFLEGGDEARHQLKKYLDSESVNGATWLRPTVMVSTYPKAEYYGQTVIQIVTPKPNVPEVFMGCNRFLMSD
jgi:hypothetical protein